MATVKAFLKDSEALKDGQYSIFLRVTQDRKHKYFKIGTSSKEDWDYDKSLPKKKHPLYRELMVNIKNKESIANKQILSWENEDTSYTADEIKQALKAASSKVTVFRYFEKTIDRLQKEGRLGYGDIFSACFRSIKKYRADKDFHFSEMNAVFINAYVSYQKNREIKDNTIFLHLRNLKTLINYAKADSVVKEGYNPFKEINLSKYKKIKTEKRAIRIEKTAEIEAFEIKEESHEWHSKNYYLFSYYTMGTNFIDMVNLTWDNIQNDLLIYSRVKTKKEYRIPLNSKALAILDYYRANKRDKYVFPILSEKQHKTLKSRHNKAHNTLMQMNTDLRDIGQKLGLDVKLTSYVARHTAATTLKRSGQSTGVIKELMGHDSERTTEIYLDELDKSILQNAVDSL